MSASAGHQRVRLNRGGRRISRRFAADDAVSAGALACILALPAHSLRTHEVAPVE
jgi:hypothetical protein